MIDFVDWPSTFVYENIGLNLESLYVGNWFHHQIITEMKPHLHICKMYMWSSIPLPEQAAMFKWSLHLVKTVHYPWKGKRSLHCNMKQVFRECLISQSPCQYVHKLRP